MKKTIISIIAGAALLAPMASFAVMNWCPAPIPASNTAAFNNLLLNVCSIIFIIVTLAIVIGFMMSAFYFILAKGDPAGMATARNWLLYSIIAAVILGAVAVFLAFAANLTT